MKKGMQRLHSVLFDSEEDLVNFKATPGNDRGMTRDQFAEAAADMVRTAREAWARGAASNPPRTGTPGAQLLH